MSDSRVPKSPRKGKYVNIRIAFLNDTVHVFQVPVKGVGLLLWEAVVNHLQLLEADYFDLEYTNHNGDDCWLDKDKTVLKQIRSPDIPLRFCVKFYTPDPGLLEDELTRYLFALQIRKDLLRGELKCSENTAALLASYIVQAEIGDFDLDEYQDPTYLAVFKFVPEYLQTHEFMAKVMDYHKQHIGESPSEADLNLLDTARKVELYGIKMQLAKDHEGVSLNLAVAHLGVLVFQHFTKINTFSWAKIRKLSFKRKKYLIKLHADTYDPRLEGMTHTPTKSGRGYYKDTVEFFFETRDRCKLFWKRCIEHHAFFRCQVVAKVPRNKARVVSRGSSFRYCGRTQKQLVEYVRENIGKRPHFERTSTSGRISSRSTSVTPKFSSKPSMHSSSADLHTSSGSRSSGSHILDSNHTPGSGISRDHSGTPHSAMRVESVDVHSDSSMSGSRSLNSPRLEHGLSLDQDVIEAVNARTGGALTDDDEDEEEEDHSTSRGESDSQDHDGLLQVSSETKGACSVPPELSSPVRYVGIYSEPSPSFYPGDGFVPCEVETCVAGPYLNQLSEPGINTAAYSSACHGISQPVTEPSVVSPLCVADVSLSNHVLKANLDLKLTNSTSASLPTSTATTDHHHHPQTVSSTLTHQHGTKPPTPPPPPSHTTTTTTSSSSHITTSTHSVSASQNANVHVSENNLARPEKDQCSSNILEKPAHVLHEFSSQLPEIGGESNKVSLPDSGHKMEGDTSTAHYMLLPLSCQFSDKDVKRSFDVSPSSCVMDIAQSRQELKVRLSSSLESTAAAAITTTTITTTTTTTTVSPVFNVQDKSYPHILSQHEYDNSVSQAVSTVPETVAPFSVCDRAVEEENIEKNGPELDRTIKHKIEKTEKMLDREPESKRNEQEVKELGMELEKNEEELDKEHGEKNEVKLSRELKQDKEMNGQELDREIAQEKEKKEEELDNELKEESETNELRSDQELKKKSEMNDLKSDQEIQQNNEPEPQKSNTELNQPSPNGQVSGTDPHAKNLVDPGQGVVRKLSAGTDLIEDIPYILHRRLDGQKEETAVFKVSQADKLKRQRSASPGTRHSALSCFQQKKSFSVDRGISEKCTELPSHAGTGAQRKRNDGEIKTKSLLERSPSLTRRFEFVNVHKLPSKASFSSVDDTTSPSGDQGILKQLVQGAVTRLGTSRNVESPGQTAVTAQSLQPDTGSETQETQALQKAAADDDEINISAQQIEATATSNELTTTNPAFPELTEASTEQSDTTVSVDRVIPASEDETLANSSPMNHVVNDKVMNEAQPCSSEVPVIAKSQESSNASSSSETSTSSAQELEPSTTASENVSNATPENTADKGSLRSQYFEISNPEPNISGFTSEGVLSSPAQVERDVPRSLPLGSLLNKSPEHSLDVSCKVSSTGGIDNGFHTQPVAMKDLPSSDMTSERKLYQRGARAPYLSSTGRSSTSSTSSNSDNNNQFLIDLPSPAAALFYSDNDSPPTFSAEAGAAKGPLTFSTFRPDPAEEAAEELSKMKSCRWSLHNVEETEDCGNFKLIMTEGIVEKSALKKRTHDDPDKPREPKRVSWHEDSDIQHSYHSDLSMTAQRSPVDECEAHLFGEVTTSVDSGSILETLENLRRQNSESDMTNSGSSDMSSGDSDMEMENNPNQVYFQYAASKGLCPSADGTIDSGVGGMNEGGRNQGHEASPLESLERLGSMDGSGSSFGGLRFRMSDELLKASQDSSPLEQLERLCGLSADNSDEGEADDEDDEPNFPPPPPILDIPEEMFMSYESDLPLPDVNPTSSYLQHCLKGSASSLGIMGAMTYSSDSESESKPGTSSARVSGDPLASLEFGGVDIVGDRNYTTSESESDFDVEEANSQLRRMSASNIGDLPAGDVVRQRSYSETKKRALASKHAQPGVARILEKPEILPKPKLHMSRSSSEGHRSVHVIQKCQALPATPPGVSPPPPLPPKPHPPPVQPKPSSVRQPQMGKGHFERTRHRSSSSSLSSSSEPPKQPMSSSSEPPKQPNHPDI